MRQGARPWLITNENNCEARPAEDLCPPGAARRWCGAFLALDLRQLCPRAPRPPALAELGLCRFARRRVAIHAHVRGRAKNAGDRPKPLNIRRRAAHFIDAAHGKFAAEDGVIAAVFVRRRAKAGRAKRETHAPVLRLAGGRPCCARAGRQRARVRPDGPRRRSTRALHLTDRSARAAALTFFCRNVERSERAPRAINSPARFA